MENQPHHKPVMADEVLGFLRLEKGYKVLDGTVGGGAHAGFILEKIQPDGFLIGIDRDEKSLEIAERKLRKFDKIYKLTHANFKNLDKVLLDSGIEKIDAVLFDLGISSYQLEDAGRGFSFEREGFLDMRMDTSGGLRAYDIVNKYSRKELEEIIRDLGQERYFRRVVGFILEKRKEAPIKSTREFSELLKKAIGRRYRSQRIHPATRTFQALRIAVNKELDNIDEALGKVLAFMRSGARICVIAFHSLEDRIIKVRFKEFAKRQEGRIITKKPVTPTEDEIRRNPRSRSAKLRVFEENGTKNGKSKIS